MPSEKSDIDENHLAAPPISVNCRNCGEKIYLSLDRWYHLNTGARMCDPKDEDNHANP